MSNEQLYRQSRLELRLTENEKKYIRQKAQYANKTISEYCRDAIISGVVIKLDTSKVVKVLTELNRIGNNINQIAKAVHSHNDYVHEDDFKILRQQFEEMKSIIIENVYNQTFELSERLNNIKHEVVDVYVDADLNENEYESENIDIEEELKNIEFEYFADDLPKTKKANDDLPEDFLKLFEEYGD